MREHGPKSSCHVRYDHTRTLTFTPSPLLTALPTINHYRKLPPLLGTNGMVPVVDFVFSQFVQNDASARLTHHTLGV